jgi:hypothetical protein
LTQKSAKKKPRTRSTEILTQYVDKLRQAGIIERSKRGPFVSSIFVIPKKDNTARPKFYLPSIYQLINRKTFPFKSPHYIKIDLKNAFFNIKIHEKSRYITTFWYAGKYWRFKYLPFGLSIAPFFMQLLANYISLQFRQKGMFAWMHLDDLIVAHDDLILLKTVLKDVLNRLDRSGIQINQEKSQLEPTTSIEFLGTVWTKEHITRKTEIDVMINKILRYIS